MTDLNRAIEALYQRNEAAPLPRPPRDVLLGIEDDPDETDNALGEAEGQSFMIDYVSSKGEASSRRITVWGIKESANGTPMLVAKCHERNRTRSFRVDRIKCCIDYDGEVHDDVPAFMEDTFGMSRAYRARQAQTDTGISSPTQPGISAKEQVERDAKAAWSRARPYLRPHAEILSAISLSDGSMHPAEVAVAVRHCTMIAKKRGFDIENDQTRLNAYIKRLRPTDKTLKKMATNLGQAPRSEITDLLVSAVELMDSDRKRHPAEVELVNQLSQELAMIDMA
ncbi:MAG: WYL domain-containing protein [Roseibium sp.]